MPTYGKRGVEAGCIDRRHTNTSPSGTDKGLVGVILVLRHPPFTPIIAALHAAASSEPRRQAVLTVFPNFGSKAPDTLGRCLY